MNHNEKINAYRHIETPCRTKGTRVDISVGSIGFVDGREVFRTKFANALAKAQKRYQTER
jgi:hypothetical protein